ncbi:hypothetical protein ACK3TF_003540 [Chlorella vulgaris]
MAANARSLLLLALLLAASSAALGSAEQDCNTTALVSDALSILVDALISISGYLCEEDTAAGSIALDVRNARLTLNDAGLEEQLGNNVTDIIDWGVQVLTPDLTDAVKSFLVVCTPVGLITGDTTGTDYTADTTADPGLIDDTVMDTGEGKGSACSAWWQGTGLDSSILDVPDSADPGTTPDGVQAAEVIAGVTDSPVFVGGGERRRA